MTRIVLTLMLFFSPLFFSLAFFYPMNLGADVLLIEPVRKTEGMNVPVNGQTMDEVESAHGAPRQKGEPVGEPPITRWDYERWSVYFEYERVLSTVLDKGEVIQEAPSEG